MADSMDWEKEGDMRKLELVIGRPLLLLLLL